MLFADLALARRIEAAEASIARDCAAAGSPVLEIGGGCAIFMGKESPLTQCVGIGLTGSLKDAEIETLESFFRSRGAKVKIDLCPLADAGLVDSLAARGYRAAEFNNVLVKRLAGLEAAPVSRVRLAEPGEGDLWSEVVGRGFFEEAALTAEEMDVGRAIFAMPGVQCYLAAEDGRPVAGAAMALHNGLAALFADSSIPGFRRRGLHGELIAARLAAAAACACDMAAASTVPGSGSQRNYERMGFEVVYTRVTLVG